MTARGTGTGRRRMTGIVVVSALSAGLLAGCGSHSGSSADSTGPLKVWVRGSGDSLKAYDKIFAAFTAKTGIKVQPYMTLTDFETKLSASASAHSLPDMVIDNASQLGDFESQGIIQKVDASSVPGLSALSPQALSSVKDPKGATYAIPFSAQANVLLVRKDWLAKLHLSPPKTWADVERVAKAFTRDDPDADGKNDTYGIDVPGTTANGYISWWWSSLLWQAGGDYVKSDGGGKYTATLDSPQAISAAQEFEKLACTDKVVQPGMLNDDTTAGNKAFQTGLTGMYLTGPYAFATMDASPVKGKYVAVAPPAGPGGSQTLAEGTSMYLMQGAKTDEAEKLAGFMITPKTQQLGMTAVPTATVVRLPVTPGLNAATAHSDDPRWGLAATVYQKDGHYEYDSLPNWTALRQLTSDDLNGMIAQCAPPAAAMKKLNSQFQAALAAQGVAG
ncbi:sugar ABC transporter substrate-binding protein [Streptomyces sp. SL13]|uniref:Sugar ABC transporter substrate-binding protein n=1 Tax=Streptantibioticus silvisoli TaxID=2705255 RepID=A0AA90KIP0_9ACTN|nr:sugar ABC transporter substrate-binding protein [Streptantibioticus silvisoli]MDI5972824.1 sugar ABC transporter substrate-binding protein [Streptantibioticus silvisoli]